LRITTDADDGGNPLGDKERLEQFAIGCGSLDRDPCSRAKCDLLRQSGRTQRECLEVLAHLAGVSAWVEIQVASEQFPEIAVEPG
jgi:hypothetical protein